MWRELDSNQRPQDYDSCELPLLYHAIIFDLSAFTTTNIRHISTQTASNQYFNKQNIRFYTYYRGTTHLDNMLFHNILMYYRGKLNRYYTHNLNVQ